MSRNLEKDSIVPSAICKVASMMVAGLVSLEGSRHRVAVAIITGMMDVVFDRSFSAEKHAV